MTKMIFVYIWEYIVREKHQGDFKKIYGPEGDWVQLFRNCEGYIATDLHQDTSNPNRFVTVDMWFTKAKRENFRDKFPKSSMLSRNIARVLQRGNHY